MIGNIHLIKISEGKLVPALCIKSSTSQMVFSQLRSAKEIEIVFYKNPKKYNKIQKGLPTCKQEPISKNVVYIDKPNGLKNESVVMLTKLHTIEKNDVLKKISEIQVKDLDSILKKIEKIQKRPELHKKMQLLKRKILIAQMNNDKYSDLENQLIEVTRDLGFTSTHTKSHNSKAYESYRVTPNKGSIKIYLGGR